MTEVAAVVLAGGHCKPDLWQASGQQYRALVRVAGRPLLAYALDAIMGAKSVSRAVVVGPAECRTMVEGLGDRISWLPSGETLLGNLLGGAEALGESAEDLLCIAADAPLVTGEVVDRIVAAALDDPRDFRYPIVHRDVCLAAYPGTKRTFVRLRDGVFTGGNVMLVTRSLLASSRERIAAAFAARKSPLRLAMLFGPSIVLRLPLGRVSIAELEQRAERMLGFPVAALVCDAPEVAVDVDKPEDLRLVEELVGREQAAVPTA